MPESDSVRTDGDAACYAAFVLSARGGAGIPIPPEFIAYALGVADGEFSWRACAARFGCSRPCAFRWRRKVFETCWAYRADPQAAEKHRADLEHDRRLRAAHWYVGRGGAVVFDAPTLREARAWMLREGGERRRRPSDGLHRLSSGAYTYQPPSPVVRSPKGKPAPFTLFSPWGATTVGYDGALSEYAPRQGARAGRT